MFKWIRCFAVVIIALIGVVIPTPVFASSANVVLIVRASNGIANFTIIYVNDKRMDLSWNFAGNVTSIMVRAKYGSYPADIPNPSTAPSDGYLVYSGNGTSVSDTSMDFNENPGGLYYAAWAQKVDGTWNMGTSNGWKESAELALIAILGFVVAMTYFSFTKRNLGLSFVGAFSWILFLVYTRANPINNIPTGSYGDTLILFACILMFAILLFTGWNKYKVDKVVKGKVTYNVQHYNQAGDYVGRHEVPDNDISGQSLSQKMSHDEYKDFLRERRRIVQQNRKRYQR